MLWMVSYYCCSGITKKCSRPNRRASIEVQCEFLMFVHCISVGVSGLAADFCRYAVSYPQHFFILSGL